MHLYSAELMPLCSLRSGNVVRMASDGAAEPVGAWLPDPERLGQLRYWDGQVWTEHRAAPPSRAYKRSRLTWIAPVVSGIALTLVTALGLYQCATDPAIARVRGEVVSVSQTYEKCIPLDCTVTKVCIQHAVDAGSNYGNRPLGTPCVGAGSVKA